MKTIIKILIVITVLVGVFLGGWFLSNLGLKCADCPELICPGEEKSSAACETNNENKIGDVKKDFIVEHLQDFLKNADVVTKLNSSKEWYTGCNSDDGCSAVEVSVLGVKQGDDYICGYAECYFYVQMGKYPKIFSWSSLEGIDSNSFKIIKDSQKYFLHFDVSFGDGPVSWTGKSKMDLETGELISISRRVCEPSGIEDENNIESIECRNVTF